MSFSATNPPVVTYEASGCLVLAIDRPEAGNSMSLEAAQGLRAGLAGCRERRDLRAAVITGAGGRFFCTGGDLKAYRSLDTKEALGATFGFVRELLHDIERHPLPVIAAIDGHALGGGAEMALACDLRFASPGASFGFPQARLGLIPGWNGTERLVATVGRSRAMRLLLSAGRLTAAEALAEGVVDVLSGEEGALACALAWVEALPAAPLVPAAIKKAVRASAEAVVDASSSIFEELWFTEDHREAERAFVEKRAPVFKGI